MIIRLTKHASDKMLLLGLTRLQVENAIKRGSKFNQTDGYLAVYGYIKVAYKIIDRNVYKIKTVYIMR